LVYDPTKARPFFEAAGIVVVHRWTVKAAVEVKSFLNGDKWDNVLNLQQNFYWQMVPTFGFCFDGVTFDSFLDYLKAAMRDKPQGVPYCVAVHSRNYVFVRSPYTGVKPDGPRHRPAGYQFAVNFGEHKDFRGMATAVFVNSFLRYLDMECTPDPLPRWLQEFALPAGAKVSLSDSGEEQPMACAAFASRGVDGT
jgi:hypothetical protein